MANGVAKKKAVFEEENLIRRQSNRREDRSYSDLGQHPSRQLFIDKPVKRRIRLGQRYSIRTKFSRRSITVLRFGKRERIRNTKAERRNDRDALISRLATNIILELATSILSVEATQPKVRCAYIDIFV